MRLVRNPAYVFGLALIWLMSNRLGLRNTIPMTPSPMPTVSSRAINYGLAGIGIALTFVILVPFSPSFPLPGLDGSAQYAMNVAVADHLRFGKDFIFNVGPLASVYTHVYSPDTDTLMIAASIVVTLAFVAGLILTATTNALPWLLLLPLIVSQVFALDSLFIILPFLLLCVCEAFSKHSRFGLAVIFLLAAASGLLPLIKGNALLSALVCTSLSVAALWQYSRGSAISVAVVALSAMILAWIGSGQSLSDLPDYFFSQQQIVAGYTDAMSWPGTAMNGNLIHLVVYLILACLLIWFTWHWTKAWRLTAGLTLTLFMCWKSGFVRHDAHALIAATGLFLSGYVVFLRTGPRPGIAALALGLGGWLAIGWSDIQVSPSEVFSRTANAISTSATGVVHRLIDPQHLKQQFNAAVAKIAQAHPLPAYSGTADVYPADLSVLLASGTKWVPRPVIQSSSAYTPALLNLNKRHLITAAPSRVYFKIQAIDNRYPSLEDGASWPTLVSHFTITGFVDDYAILQRRELPNPVKIEEPILKGRQTLGTDIAIPVHDQPVWAEIDIRPTILGRLVSALYKSAPLSIVAKYPNGASRAYRFVPGFGRAGFLLSPTVGNVRGFAALQLTDPQGIDAYPMAFEIHGTTGTWLLWEKSFDVTLSPITLPVDPHVGDLLILNRRVNVAESKNMFTGGDCAIDFAGGAPVSPKTLRVDKLLFISGWALVSGKDGEENRELLLAVSGRNGVAQWWTTTKIPRSDVGSYFHHPEIINAGFESLISFQALPPGSYDVKLAQVTRDGDMISCPTIIHVTK
jgi:hypothetical protein